MTIERFIEVAIGLGIVTVLWLLVLALANFVYKTWRR